MSDKIKIFVSYSHQNEDWVSKDGKYKLIPWLEKQLEDVAEVWTDHALKRLPGEEYTKLITEKINEADFALLLISQDFISSKYIIDTELPIIKHHYLNGKKKILPLLLTDLTKKGKEKISWIYDLQIYPNDSKPLYFYTNNDAEWEKIKVEILDGVENKIEEIKITINIDDTSAKNESIVGNEIFEKIESVQSELQKFDQIVKTIGNHNKTQLSNEPINHHTDEYQIIEEIIHPPIETNHLTDEQNNPPADITQQNIIETTPSIEIIKRIDKKIILLMLSAFLRNCLKNNIKVCLASI